MRYNSLWTPEITSKVEALWRTGISAEIISEQLGDNFTRGMIIGRMARMKIPSGNPRSKNKDYTPKASKAPKAQGEPRTRLRAKAIKPSIPNHINTTEEIQNYESSPFKAMRSEHDLEYLEKVFEPLKIGVCRFVVGDVQRDDWHFCCKPVSGAVDYPYCDQHAQICFRSAPNPRWVPYTSATWSKKL